MMLIRQHFRAQLSGLLIWLGVTALFTMTLTRAVQGAVVDDQIYTYMLSLPSALRAVVGAVEGLSPVDAYLAGKMTQVSVLLLTLYAVLQGLAAVTREVDRRTMDFLLALPVQRRDVVLARFGVLVLNTAMLALTVWVIVRLDLAALGYTVSWGAFGLALAMQTLLALTLGSLTLLGSIWIDDYSLGVKLCLSLVVAAYFAEMVLKGLDVSRLGRIWSPFSYTDAAAILRWGAPQWGELALLCAVTAVALWLSVKAFDRKQIAA